MSVILPYLPISLLFVLFLLSVIFITRKFRKNSSLIEDRLNLLEDALEKTKIALGEQSSRNTEEINHSTGRLKEDLNAALQTSIQSVMSKVAENDSSYNGRLDSLHTQITALQRKLAEQPPKTVEKPQAASAQPSAQPSTQPSVKPAEDLNSKARRLARLIVSEIALYSRKNVEQGVRDGNFYELLAHEVREARSLYERRVPEEIRNNTAYLDEAFAELILKTRKELNL